MVIDQLITDKYAIYNGDSGEVLSDLKNDSIHLVIYSPPFAGAQGTGGLYHYSSSPRDLSNANNYKEFFEHYAYIVKELYRITMPGRINAVHCMDVPNSNKGDDDFTDFPGDIIRLYQSLGFGYTGRHCIWKEPLGVRNRTLAKHLMHKTLIDDSVYTSPAGADYLLLFRKKGKNPIPVSHDHGLMDYYGESEIPHDLKSFRGYEGNQIENKLSQWIWRQYASSHWTDIRIKNVLPFREAREEEDEKHMHPLQLDVIMRTVQLYSNEGEVVLSPFAGVGSEVYGAVVSRRMGIGIELKTSYYKQMVKNMERASEESMKHETMELELGYGD